MYQLERFLDSVITKIMVETKWGSYEVEYEENLAHYSD